MSHRIGVEFYIVETYPLIHQINTYSGSSRIDDSDRAQQHKTGISTI